MADKQVKDCSVVVVKLLDEIVIRGTVKVYQLPAPNKNEKSCSDSESSKDNLPLVSKTTSESLQRLQKCLEKIPLKQPLKKSDKTQRKISVYTKINKSDVITEVKCKRFRKRKLEYEQDLSDVETAVESLISYLVERTVCNASSAGDINCTSPGVEEAELVKEFCKENGFASEDYNDLNDLFTFRTLPFVEGPTSPSTQKRTRKRKAWREPLRKILRQRSVDNQQKAITPAIRGDHQDAAQTESPPEAEPYPSGLENIENEKIRKILEDFGRLSKNQVSVNFNEQKKTLTKTKEKTPNTAQSRNSVIVKPLNLCKKDNTDTEQMKKLPKMDQPPEKLDTLLSGSILKSLLYSQTSEQTHSAAKDIETQTDQVVSVPNRTEKCHPSVAKKTKSQQTDQEDENCSLPHRHANQQTNIGVESDSTQSEIQPDKIKWINDPNALLAKIQKLKRDIVYLDLLAEEKEKERIAILCFKSYKESILRKIFANEAANKEVICAFQKECNATAPCSNGSNHPVAPVIIPQLIHTVKVPVRNGKASSTNVTLSTPLASTMRTLYPSTVSFLRALRPQHCMQSPHIKSLFGVEKDHSWSQNSKVRQETPCQDPPTTKLA